MSSGNTGGFGLGVGMAGGSSLAMAQQGQGIVALLVMLAVLCFIFAYCCWGAPFCRSLCRRHCCCRLEDPEPDSRFGNSEQTMVATPTIILLPHGRMLVVDGTIFTQFQADANGLGENVMRAQRNSRCVNRHQLQSSQGSILEMDAETPSKESMGSIGCFPPPTYESIYGKDEGEMPPSYSDILLHRFANLPYEIELQDHCNPSKEDIEMHSLDNCPHIMSNPMSTMTYHPYATIASFSSQSFARQSLSRNSSVITNPMDDFYINNEVGGIYAISHVNIPMSDSGRHISDEELRHSDLNALNLSQMGLSNPRDGPRRSTDDVNIVNVDIHRAARSEHRIDMRNLIFQASVARNGDVTLSIDTCDDELNGRASRQAMHDDDVDDRIDGQEEDNDFGALADIRESRV